MGFLNKTAPCCNNCEYADMGVRSAEPCPRTTLNCMNKQSRYHKENNGHGLVGGDGLCDKYARLR